MQHVLILGLARSGLALARLLLENGCRVTGADEALESEGGGGYLPDEAQVHERFDVEGLEFLRARGGLHRGPFHGIDLAGVDRVAISPGIPREHPFVRRCLDAGLPVEGELEIASTYSRAGYTAVTGTNGKTTVVHLLTEIIRRSGRPVELAGNVGTPFSARVGVLDSKGHFVLEVSSFQLESIRTFRPEVAVLLNVTPDHLDRYPDMESYAAAKERVLMNMGERDSLVYNADDPRCVEIANRSPVRRIPFRASGSCDLGVALDSGWIVDSVHGDSRTVLQVEELPLRGYHNVENAMAAVAAGSALGIEPDVLADGLRSFSGLPHRMEHVATFGGVEWINDSKATNVDAVIKGLQGGTRPVVLIAGGRAKEKDFRRLIPALASVRAVVLLGEAAAAMAEAFESSTDTILARDLAEAVHKARDIAQPGDQVILSPACASFDMFRDFEERGDLFKTLVRNLAEESMARRDGEP